jgi:hypothetical protein
MKIVSRQRGALCALTRRQFAKRDPTTGATVGVDAYYEWDPEVNRGTSFSDEEVKQLLPLYGGALQP